MLTQVFLSIGRVCSSAHFTDGIRSQNHLHGPRLQAYFQLCEVGADAGLALASCSGQAGVGLLWFGLLPEGRQPCLPLLYMTFKKYHLINRLWAVNTARSPAPLCLAIAWVFTYASEPCQAELALHAAWYGCQPAPLAQHLSCCSHPSPFQCMDVLPSQRPGQAG